MEVESEIAKWYRGKAIFITGATGFMGKVLVEKLLRSCPDVGPIYMLVREKKYVVSQDRVEEMLMSNLFEQVRNADENVAQRLIAIPGDVALPDMGLSSGDRHLLQETVSVVFHVAATIRFDEPLPVAMAMNYDGTKAILQLCQSMKNLCAVVHVSTAYANCNLPVIEERIYPPPADPEKISQYVELLDDDSMNCITPRIISDHPNTYTFTKALTEHLVAKYSTELPIVIVRPSIVSGSWKEPEPGWVDNFNGPTAIVVGTSKGLLKTVYGNTDISVDLIPVDMCINLFIAAAWEIGTRAGPKLVPEILVYNCISSAFSSITWNDFIANVFPCTKKYAVKDVFSVPYLVMTTSKIRHNLVHFFYQFVPAVMADFITSLAGGKPKFQRYQSKLNQMVTLLEYFTTHEWQFRAENVIRLRKHLNSTDREIFNFDVTKINWKEYFENYFHGIRKNVLKEEDDTIPASQKRIFKLSLIAQMFKITCLVSGLIFFLKYYKIPNNKTR